MDLLWRVLCGERTGLPGKLHQAWAPGSPGSPERCRGALATVECVRRGDRRIALKRVGADDRLRAERDLAAVERWAAVGGLLRPGVGAAASALAATVRRELSMGHELECARRLGAALRAPVFAHELRVRCPAPVAELCDPLTYAYHWVEGAELHAAPPAGRQQRAERLVVAFFALCHGHGIVHMDLSPRNVLVDRDGGLWLIDVGASAALDPAARRLAWELHQGANDPADLGRLLGCADRGAAELIARAMRCFTHGAPLLSQETLCSADALVAGLCMGAAAPLAPLLRGVVTLLGCLGALGIERLAVAERLRALKVKI